MTASAHRLTRKILLGNTYGIRTNLARYGVSLCLTDAQKAFASQRLDSTGKGNANAAVGSVKGEYDGISSPTNTPTFF